MNRGLKSGSNVFRTVDWVTICLYLLMVACGVVSIYAASYNFDHASFFDLDEFAGKQILWIGLGLIIATGLLLIDYKLFEIYAYPIYGLVLILLLVTIFVAKPINGSRSWLVLGPVSLQPAEFGKFATALVLAKLFDTYGFSLKGNPSNYLRALIIIFLPIILIILQRETGSALVYFALIFVLYREGMSGLVLFSVIFAVAYFVIAVKFSDVWLGGITYGEMSVMVIITLLFVGMIYFYCRNPRLGNHLVIGLGSIAVITAVLCLCGVDMPVLIIWLGALVVAAVYSIFWGLRHKLQPILLSVGTMIVSLMFLFSVNYVFSNVLEPHQQMRIKVALGIEDDLRGAGYNVHQAKIAIGSGGVTGKGFLNGTQTKLNYVPEQHTDFIFCTIGEEEGFLGAVGVLVLFTALILRLISLAERQPSPFGRVYGYCVVSYLMFHLLINVGMVIGLCPVIGIPLPFFSYGGSALWSFTILLFIFLRLDAARKEP